MKMIVAGTRWCGPCKNLRNQLDAAKIPYEYKDCETPDGQNFAIEHSVCNVPAVFLFNEEVLVDEFKGYPPQTLLNEWKLKLI